MKRSTSNTWRDPFEQLLAALLSAAFVFYPVPGLGQQSGGESSSGEADQPRESAEASGETKDSPEKKRTPEVFLLPTGSIRDQVSEIVPQRIGEMLRDRLDSEEGIDLLPTFRKMNELPGGAGEVSAAIKKARKQYTSGIGLVEAGNYEEAADQFSRAVETLRENIAQVENFNVYTDALANLARAHWHVGHNYDARKSIREFAHLRPDAELDPEKYPEKLRALYDESAQRVEKAGPGKLVVNADVEGARVYVDGQKKGEAPVTINDVEFGYHYMVVRGPRGGVWSKQLRVRGRGKEQTYDVKLEGSGEGSDEGAQASFNDERLPAFYTELQAGIKDGTFGAELQPYLEELAKQTGGKFISWVVMLKEGNEYVAAPFVYRVSDARLVRPETVGFNFQLSDLTVGVTKLNERIVEAIETMPREKAVQQVALVDEEDKENAAVVATGSTTSQSTNRASSQSSTSAESIDGPPEAKPSNESSTWKYVGIIGGILAAGGLAAGGAYLFAGPQGGSQPAGFTANVEW